jgi:hypothetical protein
MPHDPVVGAHDQTSEKNQIRHGSSRTAIERQSLDGGEAMTITIYHNLIRVGAREIKPPACRARRTKARRADGLS